MLDVAGSASAASDGRRLSIALVVPAHNEAEHILGVLSSIPEFVDRIVVVDDASTDATASLVGDLADPRVVLVRHEVNLGVGAAMKSGYRLALTEGFDLIGKMDADGQMRPGELTRLVRPFALGIAEYTKGNRFYLRDAAKGMPVHRGFGNTVLSFMTKLASGYWHVYDSQCGFTIVRAAFLRLIDLDRVADDYFFENDMLVKLNALNARVVDVPTSTVYGAEVSGVNVGRVAFTFPWRLAWRGIARFARKQLVTDFGPVGAMTVGGFVLCLFGAAFGAYHWWLSIDTDRVASTGTVMIAVLPLIVGIQLLLQAFVVSVQSSPGAAETAAYVRLLAAEGEFD